MINIEWEETFKIIFVETKRHIANRRRVLILSKLNIYNRKYEVEHKWTELDKVGVGGGEGRGREITFKKIEYQLTILLS